MYSVRYDVHMSTVVKGKILQPAPHILLHYGMKLSLESITITPNTDTDTDTAHFRLNLKMKSSYSMFGMRFVVGLVPANNGYDISTKYFHSPFARSFLTWTPRIETETKVHDYESWTVDAKLLEVIDEWGVYVFLLPVTDVEFKELNECSFGPTCRCGYKQYVTGHLRNYCSKKCVTETSSHTFTGPSIHLDTSSNFNL